MSQLPFAFWSDSVLDTTAKIVVVSLSNVTPTITINGAPYTPSMTACASDGLGGVNDSYDTLNDAGYFAVASVTGLSADTVHTYTVTQGSNTQTGKLHTDPGNTDFTLFFISCDGPTERQAGNSTVGNDGMYTYIRQYAEQNPVSLLIHVDDHGYPAGTYISDQAGTGYFTGYLPGTVLDANINSYGYAVAYLMYLGLLEDSTDADIARYHREDRQWCMQNISRKHQVGDWEFRDNAGEYAHSVNRMRAAATAWTNTLGAGATYLNKFVTTSNETGHLAWAHNIGPLQLIAYDRCTHASQAIADTAAFDTASGGSATGSGILGSQQITDILAAVDASEFKILCNASSGHFLMNQTDRATAVAAGYRLAECGAQQPLGDYSPDEYSALFLHNGDINAEGILKQAEDEVVVALHGDTHHPQVYYHDRAAAINDADDIAEVLIEISCGSVTGNNAQSVHPQGWSDFMGTSRQYMPEWVSRQVLAAADKPNIPTALQVRVRGDLSPKQMVFTLIDSSGESMWTETLTEGIGNLPENYKQGQITGYER